MHEHLCSESFEAFAQELALPGMKMSLIPVGKGEKSVCA